MLKKIKKVIAFALALTMLMGMGTMVSAAEKESSIPEYSETNDGGMTVNIAGDQEGTIVEGSGNEEGINPLWWPGDGPAPQVTSISLYKYGWLTNGNFGVTIKVYGYGSDTTTFDGRSISWIRAMNAFKDRENFTSFEMVCWDCGKHHFYKMADDKKSFIKVDKL